MGLEIALVIVGALIAVVAIVSGVTSLWLTVKSFRFNRYENSLGLTGMDSLQIMKAWHLRAAQLLQVAVLRWLALRL